MGRMGAPARYSMNPMEISGTILLVDDEPLVRKILTAILNAENFEVIEAVDGLDALLKFQTYQYAISLVIMDIVMPRLNGINAANRIRDLDPSAKFIFISGNTLQAPAEAMADAFLTKPIWAKSLLAVVHRLLREKNVAEGISPDER